MRNRIDKMDCGFALVIVLYVLYAVWSGEVVAYQRSGSDYIQFTDDPERFWEITLLYFSMAFWLFVYGIKAVFPKSIFNLLNFGLKTNMQFKQVAFFLVAACVTYWLVFKVAAIVSNA